LGSTDAGIRVELEDLLFCTCMGVTEEEGVICENLEELLNLFFKYGFIEEDREGKISILVVGNVVTLKGISCLAADDVVFFLEEARDREVSDLEILHAVASSEGWKKDLHPDERRSRT